MPKLKWDQTNERYYENGVDHAVLFVKKATVASGQGGKGSSEYEKGVAWNGITSISLTPEGAEPNDIYADNIKYLSLLGIESINATIEAYQAPVEFDECDGKANLVSGITGVTIGQQARKQFALCFRSNIGNDQNLKAYKLHIVYGCLATPADEQYETINDSPDAATKSWDVTTTPVEVSDDFKPTALVTIDSRKFVSDDDKAKLKAIEDSLFGTDGPATYTLTSDTNIVPGKTYYTRSGTEGSYVYTKVDEPVQSGLSSYYEKTGDDESVLLLPSEIISILSETNEQING